MLHWRVLALVSANLGLVGLGVGAIGNVALAAEQTSPANAATTAAPDAGAGRVFSRNNPLFGRSLPKVTSGEKAKVRVDVKASPAKSATPEAVRPAASQMAKETAVSRAPPAAVQKSSTAKKTVSAPVVINRSTASTKPNKVVVSPSPINRTVVQPKAKLKPSGQVVVTKPRVEPKLSTKRGLPAPTGHGLPTRKPAVTVKLKAQPTANVGTPAPAPRHAVNKRRKPTTSARRRVRTRPARNLRRVARLRRKGGRHRQSAQHLRRLGRPPGTLGSVVRCGPGDRCVRYYRVRRPRSYREARRLDAWTRRARAARYRAWLRRRSAQRRNRYY